MKLGKFLVGACILATAASASAQTQIRPRVLLMVDTSGSMTLALQAPGPGIPTDTGGDGSFSFHDALMTRDPSSTPGFAYGEGFSSPPNTCSNPPGTIVTSFRGITSRLYNAKTAVNDVLNGSGEINWGLMRYSGSYCALSAGPLTTRTCNSGTACGAGATCSSATATNGSCNCNSDNNCRHDEFCISGVCHKDPNLCQSQNYSMTDTRDDGTCKDRTNVGGNDLYSLAGTYVGSCGTPASCHTEQTCGGGGDCGSGTCTQGTCACTSSGQCSGSNVCIAGFCVSNDASCAACQSLLTCGVDTDCMGGGCGAVSGRAAKACGCSSNAQCPAAQGYTCSSGVCTYSWGCVSSGGVIEVDPKVAGSNAQIFPWVDGKEDYTGTPGPFETFTGDISNGVAVANPELRSKGETPLGGAARTATNWYAAIRDYSLGSANCVPNAATPDPNPLCDPQLKCRPYVLVQLTDGADTCDGDALFRNTGPVAAARGFVNSTVAGARVMNKVYVIGLDISSAADQTELNSIALGGGTAAARFANSEVDIEAALSDIVTSSVLVEKCNNADDDCNGACDEPFPDVAVTGAGCSNPHAANSCDNGALPGTHCFATGSYQCSSDQLSEVCGAPTCSGNPEDPANPTYAICARAENMHGCNGLDDDCNGVVDDCTPFVAGSCCASVVCPACNPTGVPQPETCNGCDDDCDGVIDNHLMDPTVGVVGGPPCVPLASGHDQPPCDPGVTACVNGMVVCQGAVGPMPNQCDGVSRDCTGVANTNGNCPANFMCFSRQLRHAVRRQRVPCPGGLSAKCRRSSASPTYAAPSSPAPPATCAASPTTAPPAAPILATWSPARRDSPARRACARRPLAADSAAPTVKFVWGRRPPARAIPAPA